MRGHPGQGRERLGVPATELGQTGEEDGTEDRSPPGHGPHLPVPPTQVGIGGDLLRQQGDRGLMDVPDMVVATPSRFFAITSVLVRSSRHATRSMSSRAVSVSMGDGAGGFRWPKRAVPPGIAAVRLGPSALAGDEGMDPPRVDHGRGCPAAARASVTPR